MYYYVRDCVDKPHFQARWSKEQKLWVVRLHFPLVGFYPLDYYVVQHYMKVGW